MTAFDALIPSGSSSLGAGAGGARAGGGSGDWRQAVEQAQARSWLRDRTLAAGQGRAQSGPGVSASPARPAAAGTLRTGQSFASSQENAPAAVTVPGADLTSMQADRQTVGATPVAHADLPLPVVPSPAAAPANPRGTAALPVAAAAQWEALRGNRVRKQSIHVESGEQGVSVWIRDASLNSREASHLAVAIAASLSSGRQDVASLYLNGRPLADGSQLSSPTSSE